MSAEILDVDHLHPEIHRAYYSAMKELRGVKMADILVGRIPVNLDDPVWDDMPALRLEKKTEIERLASVENKTCLYCTRGIENHEMLYCLFQFEDNTPAYYLCPECEDHEFDLEEDDDDLPED